jgi:hypothetical protein
MKTPSSRIGHKYEYLIKLVLMKMRLTCFDPDPWLGAEEKVFCNPRVLTTDLKIEQKSYIIAKEYEGEGL